jgi:hypothetical protein
MPREYAMRLHQVKTNYGVQGLICQSLRNRGPARGAAGAVTSGAERASLLTSESGERRKRRAPLVAISRVSHGGR